MTKPVLSICIPNYNRADLLLNNLRSIGKQAVPQIEVVITDDCSTENILGSISTIKKEFPKLKLTFETNQKNLGFDKNVLHVINTESGKYFWLLSNDDELIPGAIKFILDLIHEQPKLS